MRKKQSCPSRGKREEAGSRLGSSEMIVARVSFRGNALRTVQELHPWQGCRKHDYPANTEHNVTTRTRLRTKTVLWWQKLNYLFLPSQHANRGSLESIFLAELVL